MTRLVSSLVKREDLSMEAFVSHWMNEHVPLARELPGLERYSTIVPDDPEECAYDGVAILDFESAEALEAAFDSPEGERTVADLDDFVADFDRLSGDEDVHVERG